eukprot:2639489-Pyramimonas_sp.AAC.1
MERVLHRQPEFRQPTIGGSLVKVDGGGFRVDGGGFRVDGGGFRVDGGGFRLDRGCMIAPEILVAFSHPSYDIRKESTEESNSRVIRWLNKVLT